MPSIRHALLGATLAALAAALPATAAERAPVRKAAAATAAETDARVIVRFKAGTSRMKIQAASGTDVPRHAQSLSAALGIAMTDGLAITPRMQVLHAKGLSSAALVAALGKHPDVEAVYVDQRRQARAVPIDPYFPGGQTTITPAVGQWYLRASSPTLVSAVNGPTAWDITQGSASVVVAVLDTGVRYDHPDLAGKLLPGYDMVAADSPGVFTTAADGDGRDSDASDPGDYDRSVPVGDNLPGTNIPNISSWHGTQVSGLIGALTNNTVGIAGLGWNVKVLPVRVLGVNGGLDSDILAGMYWAAGFHVAGVPDNPQANWAKVINMSLGAATACGAYAQVIADLKAVDVSVVVSAGNEGLAVDAPANCPGAVAVGGVRQAGSKVGYSNLGPEVAITAPAGNCVNLTGACLFPLMTTTNLGNGEPTLNDYTDSFDATIGTSFSAPLVSATLALMYSVDPALKPDAALALLKATARPFPVTGGSDNTIVACRAPTATAQDECYCTTSTCGAGLLDAGGAVLATLGAQARVSLDSNIVNIGSTLTLSATGSTIVANRTETAFDWAILSPTNTQSVGSGSTVTFVPTEAGTHRVALTITDNTGARMTAQSTFIAVAAPASDGGGGGGALGAGWLLLLGLGTLAAARARRA